MTGSGDRPQDGPVNKGRPEDGSPSGGDEHLLDLLRQALAPPAIEPSAEEMDALRAVVASRRKGREAAAGSRSGWSSRWRPPHWPRRVAVPVLAGVVVIGTAGAAVALEGPVLPSPLRAAARAIGLPVDSQRLANTRAQLSRLEAALNGPLTESRRAELRKEMDALRADLAQLDPAERQKVAAAAHAALSRAQSDLALPPLPLPGSPPPGSPPPGAPPPGALSPGALSPGSLPPGSLSPGSLSPGSLSPGSLPPGSLSPGSLSPGSLSPGLPPHGSPLPGPLSPGSLTAPGPSSPGLAGTPPRGGAVIPSTTSTPTIPTTAPGHPTATTRPVLPPLPPLPGPPLPGPGLTRGVTIGPRLR